MTVQIPNEVGTTLAGTPSPAPIATESKDGVAQAGLADHVQQVSIVDFFTQIRTTLAILARTFSLITNPVTGRLRTNISNFSSGEPGGLTPAVGEYFNYNRIGFGFSIPVQIPQFSSITITNLGNYLTPANEAGTSIAYPYNFKNDTFPVDINRNCWAKITQPWLGRI